MTRARTTSSSASNSEKCFEAVAFAALAAHRERYVQIRADLENEWRAQKILDLLKEAHPDFYPIRARHASGVELHVLLCKQMSLVMILKWYSPFCLASA